MTHQPTSTKASRARQAQQQGRRESQPRQARPDAAPLRVAALPSFKLDVLNALTLKHGELTYQRLFGLRVLECRALGVVAHLGPVTLKQTSIELRIDKGQASRLIAQLLAAGLLERRADPADQRSFYLLLTPAGRRLHDRVAAAATARNEVWMQGLPPALQACFIDSLDLLIRQAQQMLRDERKRSGVALPPPLHQQALPLAESERPLLIAPAALRELHQRLGEMLGLDR